MYLDLKTFTKTQGKEDPPVGIGRREQKEKTKRYNECSEIESKVVYKEIENQVIYEA